MRILTLLSLIALFPTFTFTQKQEDKCATCYGNTPCRACKNCRYCKHCAREGGTCGVCKPEAKPKPSQKPKKKH